MAPRGLLVNIIQQPKYCADGAVVVPHVLKVFRDGALKLDNEGLRRDGLEGKLREVFATRAERMLIVNGDRDVSFQEVAEVIDIARKQADYVALLTPSVEREMATHPCCCLTISQPPPIAKVTL
jgi:hypothetical protein